MKTLLRLLARLPLPVLHALGAATGWLAFLMSPTYRRRLVDHAAQAGYRLAELRPAVAHAGRMVLETPRLWLGAPVPVAWAAGSPELIQQALDAGRGVLFLTPHLGCFEITAQAYVQRFGPMTVLYRPARKAWLREWVESGRRRERLDTAPASLAGVRQMLRVLRAGGVVGLLPDQVPPQGLGVWAAFFGRPAYTMTLPGRLAQLTGAQPLLAWGERLPAGRGFLIHVRRWEGELSDRPEAAALQLNAQMERLVRECPQQYLWGYGRYKQPRQELPS